MEITKIFTFDAAHFLTCYHGKCEKLHGHTYKLEITIEGVVQENGLVLDFVIFKNIVKKNILEKLDHNNLNDILKNPSSENLVRWIWQQLTPFSKRLKEELGSPNISEYFKQFLSNTDDLKISESFVMLKKIKLWETATSCVAYYGE